MGGKEQGVETNLVQKEGIDVKRLGSVDSEDAGEGMKKTHRGFKKGSSRAA